MEWLSEYVIGCTVLIIWLLSLKSFIVIFKKFYTYKKSTRCYADFNLFKFEASFRSILKCTNIFFSLIICMSEAERCQWFWRIWFTHFQISACNTISNIHNTIFNTINIYEALIFLTYYILRPFVFDGAVWDSELYRHHGHPH